MFFELFALFLAHLECLFSEIFANEGEIVVDFVESDVSGPDELFNCESFLDGGDFVG